jgi:hypothetical protein
MKSALPRVSPALVAVIVIAISIATLVQFGLRPQHDSGRIGLKVSGDFLLFWSTAKLIIQGHNPYDGELLLKMMSQTVGPMAYDMRVPTLPALAGLLIPFAILPFNIALLTWTILNVALALAGLHLVYRTIQIPDNRRKLAIKFAFISTFYPLFLAIKLAQIIPLLFFCTALFCANQDKLNDRRKGFFSGLALAVCTIKPHLFLPFLIVVSLWTLRSRMWRVAIGFIVGVASLWLFPVCFNPRVYSLFLNSDLSNSLNWRTPTIGFWLAELAGGVAYLKFLPLLLACGYALSTGLTVSFEEGALCRITRRMIPLSLACAPYLWVYDFVLLIPAIIPILHKGGNLTQMLIFGSNIGVWLAPREMEYSFWYPVLIAGLVVSVSRDRSAYTP